MLFWRVHVRRDDTAAFDFHTYNFQPVRDSRVLWILKQSLCLKYVYDNSASLLSVSNITS